MARVGVSVSLLLWLVGRLNEGSAEKLAVGCLVYATLQMGNGKW